MTSITIELEGVKIDVNFSYSPPEPQTFHSPGYGEEFEDIELYIGDELVTDLLLPYYEEEIKTQLRNLKGVL